MCSILTGAVIPVIFILSNFIIYNLQKKPHIILQCNLEYESDDFPNFLESTPLSLVTVVPFCFVIKLNLTGPRQAME